jgi:hypothetical protein
MGKAEVEKIKAMKLTSQGAPQYVCLDCREMLTNMIRCVGYSEGERR